MHQVYPQDRPAATVTTVHRLEDEAGNHVADHVREDYPDGTKKCLWRLPDGTYNLNGTKLPELPLYGAQEVAGWNPDDLIILVEGEKARDALATAGLRALGTVTGAGATPGEAPLEVLRDRRVVGWPDNDPQGREHIAKIAERLHGVAAEVLVYEWHDAPEKGDAADHPGLLSGDPKAIDRLLTDLEDAPRWEPEQPEPEDRGQSRATLSPGFPTTDLGNAERLIYHYGDDLMFCYKWNKWLAWDGRRWAVDDGAEVELRAKKVVRGIYAEASEAEDSGQRKALSDHARRSEAQARIQAMISLAQSEPGVPVRPEELDANPWLLNCENGTLDLRTGRFRSHDRFDLITKLAGGPYNPDAEAPRFEKFLSEVFDGDEELIALIRRFAGYSATGSTRERCIAILYGHTGKNGKTTLVELLQEVLGDYASNTSTETILAKTYQGVGNDVAVLKGARFVSAAEVEQGRRLAESRIKNLTGSDTVTARFLYGENFNFRPEFKLWLSTNNKPVIAGVDDAIWDRIRLVPFTQRFDGARQDPWLSERLREELPGVLAWVIRGALEWQEHGLGEAAKVTQATAEYREEQDVLGTFIESECVVDERASVGATLLYTGYKSWCEENGEKPETQTKFGRRLRERGFISEKVQRVTWYGIGLRDDRPDPEGDRRQFGASVDSLDSSSASLSGPTTSEPSNEEGQTETSSANCLNAENPIDKGGEPDPRRRLDSFRPIIDDSELNFAHIGSLSKKGLQPSNCLKPPSVEQGPLPGEEDFDDDFADDPGETEPDNPATVAASRAPGVPEGREPDEKTLRRVRWAFNQPGRGPALNLPHYRSGDCSLEVLVGSVLYELHKDHRRMAREELQQWASTVKVVAMELRDQSRP